MGSFGGSTGSILGFWGSQTLRDPNKAKNLVFEKNILAYFGPKGLGKISGLGPKKPAKIGQNGPGRVLGAIFGSSGTISDPTGALTH